MSSRARTVLKWGLVALAIVMIAAVAFALGRGGLDTGGTVASVGIVPEPGAVAADKSVTVTQESVAPNYAGAPELGGAAAPEAARESADAASTGGIDRLVIKTAAMSVEVEQAEEALKQLRAAIAKAGGEIADMTLDAGSGGTGDPIPLAESAGVMLTPATAVVTIKVPADKLDSLQADVAKLGKVLNQSAQSSDVTEQAIDLDARLKTLRIEETRLRSFLDEAKKVSDLLAVERELARVRGEIESIDAQLTYLKRQAARSTLTVTLSEPAPVVSPAGPTWGFSEAVTNGVRGAVALINTVVTAVIALLPLAAIVIAAWLTVRAILRRRAARKPQETRTDAGTVDEDAEVPEA